MLRTLTSSFTAAATFVLNSTMALTLPWLTYHRDVYSTGRELTKADAIVVFTGGLDRIDHARKLLDEGWAPRLLISGNEDVNFPFDQYPQGVVTHERLSTNTIGNGFHSGQWLRENQIGSVILATSVTHMERSENELRYNLPHGYPLYRSATDPFADLDWFDNERNALLCRIYEMWLHKRNFNINLCYPILTVIKKNDPTRLVGPALTN